MAGIIRGVGTGSRQCAYVKIDFTCTKIDGTGFGGSAMRACKGGGEERETMSEEKREERSRERGDDEERK